MTELPRIAGVYETFRSYRGVFVFLERHQRRLARSCEAIGMEAPKLYNMFKGKAKHEDVRIQATVWKAGHSNFERQEIPCWESFLYGETWKLKKVFFERQRPELKHVNKEARHKLRADAVEEGFHEILLVNQEGLIREGGITNVFFVDGETLVTPGRGMLPGITRAFLLDQAAELGIKVLERDVHMDEEFDATFLTNSIRGMVTTGPVHPIMARLVKACNSYILKEIEEYDAI
jgi:branched-subunit amino acid aminotransferase/4-amino-4-deoxychorismate lyase